jgi:hypothetical protein
MRLTVEQLQARLADCKYPAAWRCAWRAVRVGRVLICPCWARFAISRPSTSRHGGRVGYPTRYALDLPRLHHPMARASVPLRRLMQSAGGRSRGA